MTNFTSLFSPVLLGGLELKNRLVRSATYEALANNDGYVTDRYLDFYRRLAAGGVGLIVTGISYTQEDGKSAKTIGVSDDRYLEGLSALTSAVHNVNNNCKIAVQLNHCGRQMNQRVARERIAPSAVFEPFTGKMPREMTLNEIETVINSFIAAIQRAKKAGFDAVQLHAAHGWLLSSFLSPHTNRRTDIYGGSTENRTRIMTEIIKRAQSLIGTDYPIFAKINASDYLQDGIELPEALKIGKILEDAGYVALEISSCMWETATRKPEEVGWQVARLPEGRRNICSIEDEAYHRDFSKEFKKHLEKAKIILVGGLRTPDLMEDILESGDADLVSLCRPLIREPELPQHWFLGSNQKAACISCNACLDTLHTPQGGLLCPLANATK